MKKKKIKITEWKLENDLTTDEAMVAFIEAAMEENDPEFLMSAIREIIRIRGVTNVARETKINKDKLYKTITRESKIDVPTFLKFMDYFNIVFKPMLKSR